MRRFVWALVASGLLATQVYSAAPGQQTPAGPTDATMNAYRKDLQGERADIMAKNLTLTAEQAAKFWPEYAKFQAEQSAILDEQLKGIQQYVAGYAKLDDATALTLVKANLARDAQMQALRTKWLAEFQKIVPTRTAARVIQIDRRLGLAHQLSMSAQIPLIE
jgi:Spy/CpxP family protein refolding chaperone